MTATPSFSEIRLEVLRQRSDFLRVARTGRKWAMPGLVLQVAPTPDDGDGDDVARFGLTASRKVGNAVRRNRARRRLRALARLVLVAHAVPGHDYVLIARHTTPERPFDALIGDLKAALSRLKVTRPQPGLQSQAESASRADRENKQ